MDPLSPSARLLAALKRIQEEEGDKRTPASPLSYQNRAELAPPVPAYQPQSQTASELRRRLSATTQLNDSFSALSPISGRTPSPGLNERIAALPSPSNRSQPQLTSPTNRLQQSLTAQHSQLLAERAHLDRQQKQLDQMAAARAQNSAARALSPGALASPTQAGSSSFSTQQQAPSPRRSLSVEMPASAMPNYAAQSRNRSAELSAIQARLNAAAPNGSPTGDSYENGRTPTSREPWRNDVASADYARAGLHYRVRSDDAQESPRPVRLAISKMEDASALPGVKQTISRNDVSSNNATLQQPKRMEESKEAVPQPQPQPTYQPTESKQSAVADEIAAAIAQSKAAQAKAARPARSTEPAPKNEPAAATVAPATNQPPPAIPAYTPQSLHPTKRGSISSAAANPTALPEPVTAPPAKTLTASSAELARPRSNSSALAPSSASSSSSSSDPLRRISVSMALSAFAPSKKRDASPPPIYNENGVELAQPITINPRTGKPRVKKHFARRYASLILNHVAKENAKAATKEALEYKKRKQAVEQQVLLTPQAMGRRLKVESMKVHGRKISVADYFSQLIPFPKSQAEEDEEQRMEEEKEAKIRALLGEDPTQKNSDGSLSGVGGGKKGGDNSSQIEALHKAGNIFNAILKADRKQVDALLRANPHVLSQRGPVGELPLHMSVENTLSLAVSAVLDC